MEHVLPDLPYDKNSLAPHMSAETFEFHHGRHHAAYVANLNKLIKGTEYQDMKLEEIMKNAIGPVFNNAAQHWNHSFFWKCLRPKQDPELDEGFTLLINKNFGSLDSFKSKFIEAGTKLFGSGWVWLIDKGDEELVIETTENAGNPIVEEKKPLLVVDVWEHAYYIDYRNRRPDYLESVWQVINWEFVMHNHMAANKVKA